MSDTNAALTRASAFGWGVRHYAGKLAFLLPKQISLEDVVSALSGLGAASVSIQSVSLEHAYLEVMHAG